MPTSSSSSLSSFLTFFFAGARLRFLVSGAGLRRGDGIVSTERKGHQKTTLDAD